jgi:hypothetical protein
MKSRIQLMIADFLPFGEAFSSDSDTERSFSYPSACPKQDILRTSLPHQDGIMEGVVVLEAVEGE